MTVRAVFASLLHVCVYREAWGLVSKMWTFQLHASHVTKDLEGTS